MFFASVHYLSYLPSSLTVMVSMQMKVKATDVSKIPGVTGIFSVIGSCNNGG